MYSFERRKISKFCTTKNCASLMAYIVTVVVPNRMYIIICHCRFNTRTYAVLVHVPNSLMHAIALEFTGGGKHTRVS